MREAQVIELFPNKKNMGERLAIHAIKLALVARHPVDTSSTEIRSRWLQLMFNVRKLKRVRPSEYESFVSKFKELDAALVAKCSA